MSASSLLFVVFLISSFVWIYRYIFKHDLIQNYTNKLHLPKSRINEYIVSNLNYRFKTRIIPLDVDIDDDDDNDLGDKIRSQQQEINHIKELLVGFSFAITITLSIGLIVLMLCELIDVMNVDIRLGLFHFTIDSLIILLTVVQPFLIINLLVNHDIIPSTKKNYYSSGFTIALFLLWFFVLHKCGDLSRSFVPPRLSNDESSKYIDRSILERKINEISIAGITILAILSGIGSTSTPYKLFSMDIILDRLLSVTESDINSAIGYFNNTTTLLRNRKQDLNKYLVASGGRTYNEIDNTIHENGILSHEGKPRRLGNIVHKVQSFASLPFSSGNSEENELKREIDSITSLRNSLYNDITKLISKYLEQNGKKETFENEILNTLYKWGYLALGIYCVYRIINVLLIRLPRQLFYSTDTKLYQLHSETNVIQDDEQKLDQTIQTPSKDALATTLAKIILLFFRDASVSETQLVNQLSFVLSGGLFICSFSNVFNTFRSFTRFFPSGSSSSMAKSWLKHIIIAQLLGIYVIATALLIRTNLPSNLSNQISKILSLSGSSIKSASDSIQEVEFIDKWFDKVFGFTVVITSCSLVIRKYFDESNLDPYSQEEYDEENLLEGSR
ncbi:Abscisic acid G-protein coupled receptor-domain-containing protein [Scheffersomyces amazonensis]|uniref:Abscisic acid G-protein coupled receptor-domain-containing protein n=1 Tax=Scheffersomyces amazonensis TaxID=1078765 RepID=UPI00315CD2FB